MYIRFRDYCCQGGENGIETSAFRPSDLEMPTKDGKALVFCPLGNQPKSPKLAVVGITPGGQSKRFEDSLKETGSVEKAAKTAAFAGAHDAIRALLSAHGFLEELGIACPANLNDSDAIFTTSLVKCCVKSGGSYLYKAPDICASETATYCLLHRFIGDIEHYRTIRHIIILGAPGWEAVTTIKYQGFTVKAYFEAEGLKVLNMPHFAQNYQQRAIYALDPERDNEYFEEHPTHQPYLSEAARMRDSAMREVERLRRSNSSTLG